MEVKKTFEAKVFFKNICLETKMGLNKVEDFQEKVEVYKTTYADAIVLAAYLSLSGFTDEASDYCLKHGIAMADKIEEL